MGLFRWGAPLFAWWGHRVYPPWVVKALISLRRELPPEAHVLDLGGGPGTLIRLMNRKETSPRLHFWVGDPERAMLRVAHLPTRLQLRAEALPFKTASLDAVLIGEALHHFQHPVQCLTEVARVLRPGGRLFVFEFHPGTRLGGWIARMERWAGEPAHFFPPERLEALLRDVGIPSRAVVRGWRYVMMGTRP